MNGAGSEGAGRQSLGDKQFRFQELDVWRMASSFTGELFDLADQLEDRKCFRFAEQLRASTLSITNNIAEGSGSLSQQDFAAFLNIARRSVFETANMLVILVQHGYFQQPQIQPLLERLEQESRMLLGLIRKLRS